MKKYSLYALEYRGNFICNAQQQENGEIFLTGYFESDPHKRESLYILNYRDKEVTT